MDIRWQEDQVRRDCAVHAREFAGSQEQEWTMWRGGFVSTHRHVTDTQGRWLKDSSKLGRPRPLVFFNAFPKHWGQEPEAARECICHTVIPRGTLEDFRGGSLSRSRLRAATGGANAGSRLGVAAGASDEDSIPARRPLSASLHSVRASHLETMEAARRIGERGDVALQHRTLATHLQQIESALAALAAVRAKARVDGRGLSR
jgi:hypothetical protein